MGCQQTTYSYDFAYLKPVENGRLSSAVESQDQDSHLARADEASKVADKSTCERRKWFSGKSDLWQIINAKKSLESGAATHPFV